MNKKNVYAIIQLNKRWLGEILVEVFAIIIIILVLIIVLLTAMAVMQIKMAGMQVKDFWSFIKANDTLDKLYVFAVKYEKLSPQEQIIFLEEAEKVFSAFEKVPDALWEEEYDKYMRILDKYKDIKIVRWELSNKNI